MPKRKAENIPPLEESDSESSSDENEDLKFEPDEEQSDVEVEFSFDDPKEINFKSIRNLLKKYIPGTKMNLSELSDSIVKQVIVGTMISVDDTGDAYGFATVLNIKQQENISYMKDLIDFISQACPSDLSTSFKTYLNNPKTGMLFNERLINVPDELIPPLHKCIYDDIEYAKKKGVEDEPKRFNLENIIMISPCYYFADPQSLPTTTTTTTNDDDKEEGEKNKKKNKKSKVTHNVNNAQFLHYEDSIYLKYSKCSFLFHVTNPEECENDPDYRCVMVVTYKDFKKVVDELQHKK